VTSEKLQNDIEQSMPGSLPRYAKMLIRKKQYHFWYQYLMNNTHPLYCMLNSTQEVVEHSDQCSCPEPPCNQQVASDDGEDNASKECIICMEEFAVGSAVSWSPRVNGCRHVFHKNCIRQWVRKRWLLVC
jgi:hypothetical protein